MNMTPSQSAIMSIFKQEPTKYFTEQPFLRSRLKFVISPALVSAANKPPL